MRDATDIQLDQLIVHILDPKRPDGFVLSECTIPLDGNQRLIDYFVAHIQNSLKDSAAKAARFVVMDNEVVSGICKALLDDRLDLVEGSRQLAQKLYKIIADDGRIKACDLAVCFYRAENQHSMSRYLALLKIDPSEVFRHKKERDPQGNLYVNYEIEAEVMPTTREKLQKCAFIQQLEPRPDYDMMLLDRQKRGDVAKFFIKDFMGAEPTLDARERTDRLYNGLVSARNQIREDLQPHENESVRQAIQVAINSDRVNIDALISTLPLSEERKKQFDQVVSQKLPDREFEIDKTYAAQKLTRKLRFHGDHDLRVEVSEENYKKVIISEEHVRKPGTPPYYCIVIHTGKWEEVTR